MMASTPRASSPPNTLGIARICCCRTDRSPQGRGSRIKAVKNVIALVRLPGRDLHLDNNPAEIVNNVMLLVAWLKAPIAPAGRHAGVRIGDADLLAAPGLLRMLDLEIGLGVLRHITIRVGHGTNMAHRKAFPTDIGSDQRGVDMRNLALGDPGCHTTLNRPLKDAPKPLGFPALSNTGQRRMIQKPLVGAMAPTSGSRD